MAAVGCLEEVTTNWSWTENEIRCSKTSIPATLSTRCQGQGVGGSAQCIVAVGAEKEGVGHVVVSWNRGLGASSETSGLVLALSGYLCLLTASSQAPQCALAACHTPAFTWSLFEISEGTGMHLKSQSFQIIFFFSLIYFSAPGFLKSAQQQW